ncbi:GRB10-interacting GYF protein 1 isoform X2 [Denticeps clupeoides]|uniref:GYF domain-containing protein n=1 Tax=Denticeps clupeoides TaxID=299321 RepID=A0AAY3ZWU5_9TELE|nr:GRB10-interacting GYF protein 1-like isoform X2 [Denticeps clupeoides]
MTAETLNFGPEWLRALSRGGSVTSPPPSPAMPKSKLAEYRYGREEMLALYIKDNKVPEDMQDKEFAAILQEEPLQPLALVPLTEEEQRSFSMSVNSVAVLRLMGKGGGAVPAGLARGRGSTRGGRGRGRGEGGFYQRASDEEVGFGRSREMHRSQSWDDRGERRFEKPLRREAGRGGFEEGGAAGRKDYARSDSDNWRTLREEQDEDDSGEPGGSWRMVGGRRDDGGPRSAGWRDHSDGRRRKFDFDFRDGEGGRRRAGSDGLEDDRDGLPEWCTDEEDGEMGTFDSSGAFMCIKKSSRDPIRDDQELEFEALEEEDEEEEESKAQERKGSAGEGADESEAVMTLSETEVKVGTPSPPLPVSAPAPPQHNQLLSGETELKPSAAAHLNKTSMVPAEDVVPVGGVTTVGSMVSAVGLSQSSKGTLLPTAVLTDLHPPGGDNEEEDGMKHLQQEAEKMVASLQDTSLEEECFTQALQESHIPSHTHPHPTAHSHAHPTPHTLAHSASALPLSHEAAMKWFYKDPQGEIQGPFSTVEMCEWFQAGYFTMTLLVKRGCDEGFQPLGEVIKMWGRVPFSPGPSPPPLLGNMDQEVLKKQLEQAATAALYQQLQMRFQQMNRCGESGILPAMSRSMSVPDSGAMWDMHTSASQPSGGEASLWDLSPQGPILEQLQQKLQLERREAELRVKREEEERKRRDEKRRQEEQKRREEEELYRRKQQCRQQQELILKLLQQQSQQQQGGVCVSQQGSNWSSSQNTTIPKHQKPPLSVLELEAERLLKQQQQQRSQQQRDRQQHGGLSLGAQWGDGVGGMWGSGMVDGKVGGSSGAMGVWDEALKSAHRSVGLKSSRSSPSLSDQYIPRRKRTEEEEKLLKLLQGMKPQDGFTTWSEQMLHALSASVNNTSSLDVATIVAYLKEVESPYEVHDFIRSYLGDTVEAKEFAKQFLERRAKQKANYQRQQQQQQLSKEMSGLNMNFPLQSMFQASHIGKGGLYDAQGGKMKKKPSMMLHSDPSILGYLGAGERMILGEMETVDDY